ncbi:sulfite exporter TauE/SafE family protein [Vallitalea okinawensis]|uniref:sulfite exporter TauE/SafE family protein n=1 Tax=Vallitalea okinawensis TaxID=2078660 RepID=UPI000CFAAA72|nr:sulfite exporter TauE/SafE family protein [Vallitalea okinawensis]
MDYLILSIAGGLAGIATGLVGVSAAAIVVPLLVTFLGTDPYVAIGMALFSDVFASATSALTYRKNKNIDIMNSLYLLGSVLVFTLIFSYISSLSDTKILGSMTNLIVIILGTRFLARPILVTESNDTEDKNRTIKCVICGALCGAMCGYLGAGGGIALLIILTSVLKYDVKTAVGTSVFIMTFTALIGGVSHMIIMPHDILYLFVCCLTAFIGAKIAAAYANKLNPIKLNKVVGVFLLIFGIMITSVNYLI